MQWPLLRILSFSIASSLLFSGCFESSDSEAEAEEAEESEYREEKEERDAIRKKVTELKAQKKELEQKLEGISESVEKQDEIRSEEVKLAGELEAARAYAAALDTLEQNLDAGLSVWRQATRSSFKGVKLPEIVTVSGAKYTDVTIQEVGDESLAILHSGGEAALPILDLPLGLRKNLIHEPTVLAETGL